MRSFVLAHRWEIALYLLLIGIAAGLRLWDLGARPIHFDESLRLYYSWSIPQGLGYSHTPELHGPFLYYTTGAMFALFGASEAVARILPALFGTALVALPIFLRPLLGRGGSLLAAAFLTFSPSMLYFSRFARNEAFILLCTLALVICLWRYLHHPRPRYLHLSALALSLAFCAKELIYLTVAILGSFLLFLTVKATVSRGGEANRSLSPAANYLVWLVALTLPLFAAVVNIPAGWLGHDLSQPPYYAAIAVVALFFAASAYLGLRWNWRLWLPSFALFWGIYALLYTSLFTQATGLATGIWGSLDYWLGRHGAGYGQQPGFYYLVLLGVYEFVPLLLGVAGGIYYALKGDLFSRFMLYWAAASFLAYSLVGVKMPWEMVHVLLPLVLLAARFISQVFLQAVWRGVRGWGYCALVVVLLGLMGLTGRAAWQASFQRPADPVEMFVYAQGTPEMAEAMAGIEALAQETGAGEGMEITADLDLHNGWPWWWYLRDYVAHYQRLSTISAPPRGSVVIVAVANQERAQPFLDGFEQVDRFAQFRWYPERYKGLSLGDFWHGLWSAEAWKRAGRYFLFRETSTPYPSGGALIYYAEGLAPSAPP